MGYEIEAIIAKTDTLALLSRSCKNAQVISLKQGFGLIPLIDELFDEWQSVRSQHKADPFTGFSRLSSAVADQLRELSKSGQVAYIEAEFFGGVGGQSSVAWTNNRVSFGPEHTQDAINQVLRHLGVVNAAHDEFDTLGLGQNRHTERWGQPKRVP